MENLNLKKIPIHIAFIVDGNRRWAKKNNLPVSEGHRKGLKNVLNITEECLELGIKVLTFYLFSTENWNRAKKEVNFLMRLAESTIEKELENFHSRGIKFNAIGRIDGLPLSLQKQIEKAEILTKNNKRAVLNMALNYGGRLEIVDATKKIVQDALQGIIKVDELNENKFSQYLYSSCSDPDLLIRTSGEIRVSNFLLWQIAYTEFYFTSTYWPDFGKEELHQAIKEYQQRERRIGK